MNKLLLLLISGFWLGLVFGLSFIEAPLKFQAPGITTALGLGIGKLVFGVLNKIELVLAVGMIVLSAKLYKNMPRFLIGCIGTMLLILTIQTLFLFPILDARIDLITSGQEPPHSNHHIYYVVMEVLKLPLLLLIFLKTYKL